MTVGVVVFPGSNCDHDAWYAFTNNLGQKSEFIWHDSASLGNVDAVVLPGGFSYGDYLRCGAIAKFSPVMNAVRRFAQDGGLGTAIRTSSPAASASASALHARWQWSRSC